MAGVFAQGERCLPAGMPGGATAGGTATAGDVADLGVLLILKSMAELGRGGEEGVLFSLHLTSLHP